MDHLSSPIEARPARAAPPVLVVDDDHIYRVLTSLRGCCVTRPRMESRRRFARRDDHRYQARLVAAVAQLTTALHPPRLAQALSLARQPSSERGLELLWSS
jgi:hypothetical protein